MPRCARIKCDNSIYHIIVRSIKEISLFKNNKDKELYLSLVKECQTIYGFKVYGYCLMRNHAHFIINPLKGDISKIMHYINFKYANAYNKKYKRYGHLFQDRFKSKIITDNYYLFALSAYIHKNPTNIKEYKNCPEKYPFSSLSVYLGQKIDAFNILDEDYILNMLDENRKDAIKRYINYIYEDHKDFNDEGELNNEKTEYRSGLICIADKVTPKEIMTFISSKHEVPMEYLYIKNKPLTTNARALAVLFLRGFCNLKIVDICSILGNITSSRVSKLCSIALDLITSEKYRHILEEFKLKYCNFQFV